MTGPNEWHDYVRLLLLCVTVFALITLLYRAKQGISGWNEKTKDYWFAMLMWVLAGGVLLIQGVTLDRPFTPGTVFLAAAVLTTGRGLHRKGTWGGRN